MGRTVSQPQATLLASALPKVGSWRIHGVCLCKVGGYASATFFLAYLSTAIGASQGTFFLLPRESLVMGLNFMVCYAGLKCSQAFAEYRWGQKVLHQPYTTDPKPVPLSTRISMSLWWLSLFRITVRSDEHADQKMQQGTGSTALLEAPPLYEVKQVEEGKQRCPVPIEMIRISFFDTCAIFLLGTGGKCVEIAQKLLSRRAALLCLLGINTKGIGRSFILRALYQHVTENTFEKDRPRTLENINDLAKQSGFLPLHEVSQIIVSTKQPLWRAGILVQYDLELMRFLQLSVQRIKDAKANGKPLDRMNLRADCLYAMSAYGDGFLARPQIEDHLHWSWAKDPFLEYRSAYVTLLQYAAELELAASKQAEENPEECLRYAALYLECAMLAILKVIPDRMHADDLRRKSLKLYHLLRDEQAIERVNMMSEMLMKQRKR